MQKRATQRTATLLLLCIGWCLLLIIWPPLYIYIYSGLAPHCCTKPTRSPPQPQLRTHITRLPAAAAAAASHRRRRRRRGELACTWHSRLGFEYSECCCCLFGGTCRHNNTYVCVLCRQVPLPSGCGFLLLLLLLTTTTPTLTAAAAAAGYYITTGSLLQEEGARSKKQQQQQQQHIQDEARRSKKL
jgi:hypothetical protein